MLCRIAERCKGHHRNGVGKGVCGCWIPFSMCGFHVNFELRRTPKYLNKEWMVRYSLFREILAMTGLKGPKVGWIHLYLRGAKKELVIS